MYTNSEGVILKQTKIAGGRRMIVLLTEKYGKISAGTSIPEKGKNKSSLALRPFTKGRYELYVNRESYNINAADTLESFYAIGEDVDKYLSASYVLELCDKMFPENENLPGVFKLLCDYLSMLSAGKSDCDTLLIAFQIKSLVFQGLSLSQNPLMNEQSNDKIEIVRYIEKHPMSSLEGLSISQPLAGGLESFIKQYFSDNLGIENLKSESLHI